MAISRKAPSPVAPLTWPVLGGLRFLFAFLVFMHHADSYTTLPRPLTWIPMFGSDAAVLGFFVISGFSIAHSLQQQPKGFYTRRLTRIYPLYFAGMVLACLPFILWGQLILLPKGSMLGPTTLWPLLGNFFFLQGTLVPNFATNAVAWSLAVEVIYYALAPLLARLPLRLLQAGIVVSAALYAYHDQMGVSNFVEATHGISALFFAWAWLSGFVFYFQRDSEWAALALIGLGTFLMTRLRVDICPYAAATFAVSMFLLTAIPRLQIAGLARARIAAWGTYLGNLSYPLYIIHYPLMVLCLGGHHRWLTALCVPLSLAGCVAAYHLIDAPYQAYAHRRRPAALVPHAPAVANTPDRHALAPEI